MDSTVTVHIPGLRLLRETGGAYGFGTGGEPELWLPRAAVTMLCAQDEPDRVISLTLPRWLALDRGLVEDSKDAPRDLRGRKCGNCHYWAGTEEGQGRCLVEPPQIIKLGVVGVGASIEAEVEMLYPQCWGGTVGCRHWARRREEQTDATA